MGLSEQRRRFVVDRYGATNRVRCAVSLHGILVLFETGLQGSELLATGYYPVASILVIIMPLP